jgi:hypothetical protein
MSYHFQCPDSATKFQSDVRMVLVHAQWARSARAALDRCGLDREVCGIYAVGVPANLCDGLAARCALDGLLVRVGCELRDYRFMVYDLDTSTQLEPSPDATPYAWAGHCTHFSHIGHLG